MTDQELHRWQDALARLCAIADITADELLKAGFTFKVTDKEDEE